MTKCSITKYKNHAEFHLWREEVSREGEEKKRERKKDKRDEREERKEKRNQKQKRRKRSSKAFKTKKSGEEKIKEWLKHNQLI